MVAVRHARGILAGAGVTGSLLAAAVAGLSMTGGVLAFHGWPAAPAPGTEPVLSVAPAAHETPAPALTLAAPHAAAATTIGRAVRGGILGVTHTGRARATPLVQRRTTSRLPLTPVSPTAPSSSPQTPATGPATPVQSRTAPLADAVEGTSSGAARVLRDVTGATAKAVPPAAPAIQAAGEGMAGVVEQAGQTAGQLIRGPGGG